jgi:putative phosphoesterase
MTTKKPRTYTTGPRYFTMRIGVVSDTHGYFDPNLAPLLQGVDKIFHAGDVGSKNVLDQLRVIAPVRAVRGNVDSADLRLPDAVRQSFGAVRVQMQHDLAARQATLREWAQAGALEGKPAEQCRRFLEGLPEECQVVIFGHTHEPCAIILQGRLFFNPGSAGKKRFSLPRCCGLLEISEQGVQATFLGLERYNDDLPEGVYLPLGGAKAWGNC